MKPGATVIPDASMRRAAFVPSRSPTAAMRPSRMPTSATTGGVPLPSTTDPPVISRSNRGWRAGPEQLETRTSRKPNRRRAWLKDILTILRVSGCDASHRRHTTTHASSVSRKTSNLSRINGLLGASTTVLSTKRGEVTSRSRRDAASAQRQSRLREGFGGPP